MEYRELPPIAELAADVACVWYDDRPAHEQLVLPDGCIDIVWIRGQRPEIAGPATLPVRADLDQPVLGVRFRPGRAPGFLGVSADALLNSDVPLREAWGDEAERLGDALDRSTSCLDALALVQQAALRMRAADADPLVSAVVDALDVAPETHVSELGDRYGISERQLLRRFGSAIGYGPRVLARVLRFQRFMRLLNEPHARSWDLADLAAEVGYADHAHLTRECTRLAGAAPSVLRAS